MLHDIINATRKEKFIRRCELAFDNLVVYKWDPILIAFDGNIGNENRIKFRLNFFNIGMCLASLIFPSIGKYLTFNIIITTRYSIASVSKALKFFNSKSTRSRGNYFSPISYP